MVELAGSTSRVGSEGFGTLWIRGEVSDGWPRGLRSKGGGEGAAGRREEQLVEESAIVVRWGGGEMIVTTELLSGRTAALLYISRNRSHEFARQKVSLGSPQYILSHRSGP